MNTHFTEYQLRKRGWTDNNLYLLNDLWEQKYHKGILTWVVPTLDALGMESSKEFIKGLPGCPVRGELEK